jgi:hypothetical protein
MEPSTSGIFIPKLPRIRATIKTPDVPNLSPPKDIRPNIYPSANARKAIKTLLPKSLVKKPIFLFPPYHISCYYLASYAKI